MLWFILWVFFVKSMWTLASFYQPLAAWSWDGLKSCCSSSLLGTFSLLPAALRHGQGMDWIVVLLLGRLAFCAIFIIFRAFRIFKICRICKIFKFFRIFQNFQVFQIFKLLLELIKLQKVLTLFLFLLDFLVFVPLPSISLQAQELLGCGW